MLLTPGGLADASPRDRADDRVLRRGDRHRHADAGDDQRDQQLRVRPSRARRQRDPGQPGRLQRAARRPSAGARRCGRRARRPPARRAGTSPSTAAAAGRPRARRSRARSAAAARRRTPPRTATPNDAEDRRVAGRERRASGTASIGSIGSACGAPRRTNATSRTSAGGQRQRRPRGSPSRRGCRAPGPTRCPSAAAVISARPRQVERACRRRSSRRSARARTGSPASPIGTLSQKIHCQSMPCDDRPPMNGPAGHREAGDGAEQADRGAAALGREGGAERAPGRAAAPSPRRRPGRRGRRSASRRSAPARRPPTRRRTAPSPMAYSRRRPKRSPSAAAVISSTAKLRL